MDTQPLSSKYGTHKTVQARLWPCLSGRNLGLCHSEAVSEFPDLETDEHSPDKFRVIGPLSQVLLLPRGVGVFPGPRGVDVFSGTMYLCKLSI